MGIACSVYKSAYCARVVSWSHGLFVEDGSVSVFNEGRCTGDLTPMHVCRKSSVNVQEVFKVQEYIMEKLGR